MHLSSTYSLKGFSSSSLPCLALLCLALPCFCFVADMDTTNTRLDTVSELTHNEELFTRLEDILSRFLDLEHLIALCIQIPKTDSVRLMEHKIVQVPINTIMQKRKKNHLQACCFVCRLFCCYRAHTVHSLSFIYIQLEGDLSQTHTGAAATFG